MGFLPTEIERFKALSDEMVKLVESVDTTAQASVKFSKIGRICIQAIAQDAADSAKKATRTENSTKFQTARQNRIQAKRGGNSSATPSAQGTSRQQRSA
jgi:hypothetical protein